MTSGGARARGSEGASFGVPGWAAQPSGAIPISVIFDAVGSPCEDAALPERQPELAGSEGKTLAPRGKRHSRQYY
jgi:hypothetical protein